MTVFVLLGSDDYMAREVLEVYSSMAALQNDIANKRFEEKQPGDVGPRLISRQGRPVYHIVEKEVRA